MNFSVPETQEKTGKKPSKKKIILSVLAVLLIAAVARRVASLVQRCGVQEGVTMSGGVALNKGLVCSLEEEIRCKIAVHEDCQLAGAIGAALFARQSLLSAE